jgi:hypothetical protein
MGLPYQQISAVPSGIQNEVQDVYNGLGQLSERYVNRILR